MADAYQKFNTTEFDFSHYALQYHCVHSQVNSATLEQAMLPKLYQKLHIRSQQHLTWQ